MVWIDRVFIIAELLGDGLTSYKRASGLRIAVVLLTLDDFNNCLIYDRRKLEAIGSARFSKAKIDHGLFVVLGEDHLFLEKLADGVVHVGARSRPVLHLGPGRVGVVLHFH